MKIRQLERARQWWAQRPLKERWMLAAASAFLVIGLADMLWLDKLRRETQRESAQILQRKSSLQEARLALAAQERSARSGELSESLARVKLAESRLSELRTQASESARLPEMLRALTQTVGDTRLLALDLSPVSSAAAGAAAAGGLHRLPVTMKVGGSWNELGTLLNQLERHAQALHWSRLTLDSSKWPLIELTLTGHALSPNPHWGQTP